MSVTYILLRASPAGTFTFYGNYSSPEEAKKACETYFTSYPEVEDVFYLCLPNKKYVATRQVKEESISNEDPVEEALPDPTIPLQKTNDTDNGSENCGEVNDPCEEEINGPYISSEEFDGWSKGMSSKT